MTTDQKEKCRKAYYHSDIEPTLDRLNQIKEIVSNFEKDGANRLTCALEMKHKDSRRNRTTLCIYSPSS